MSLMKTFRSRVSPCQSSKREWTTPKGEQKSAWVVDYTDTTDKRRLKTFQKKKEADTFAATASVQVRTWRIGRR